MTRPGELPSVRSTTIDHISVSYAGGFIEHYVMPVLYPVGLTRARQLALGVVVAVVNGLMYWRLVRARVSVWRAGGEERE
jgi:hypothetical protein